MSGEKSCLQVYDRDDQDPRRAKVVYGVDGTSPKTWTSRTVFHWSPSKVRSREEQISEQVMLKEIGVI